MDIFSSEYKDLVDQTRLIVLAENGFTIEEYRIIKDSIAKETKSNVKTLIDNHQQQIDELKNRQVPTEESIKQIAESVSRAVASEFIKPPQIIHQIVKETTIEKPQVIRETKTERVIEERAYNEKPLQEKLGALSKRLDEFLKVAKPEPVDTESLKDEIRQDFSKHFAHNIDMLGMPNFRKLAMGLQQQIDDILSNGTGGGSGGTYTQLIGDGATRDFAVTGTPKAVFLRSSVYFPEAGYIDIAGGIMTLTDTNIITPQTGDQFYYVT